MKVKELVAVLTKYSPEMEVILDFSEGDHCWLSIDRVATVHLSERTGNIYYDPDDAFDGEAGKEIVLDEMIAIRSLAG